MNNYKDICISIILIKIKYISSNKEELINHYCLLFVFIYRV